MSSGDKCLLDAKLSFIVELETFKRESADLLNHIKQLDKAFKEGSIDRVEYHKELDKCLPQILENKKKLDEHKKKMDEFQKQN